MEVYDASKVMMMHNFAEQEAPKRQERRQASERLSSVRSTMYAKIICDSSNSRRFLHGKLCRKNASRK